MELYVNDIFQYYCVLKQQEETSIITEKIIEKNGYTYRSQNIKTGKISSFFPKSSILDLIDLTVFPSGKILKKRGTHG